MCIHPTLLPTTPYLYPPRTTYTSLNHRPQPTHHPCLPRPAPSISSAHTPISGQALSGGVSYGAKAGSPTLQFLGAIATLAVALVSGAFTGFVLKFFQDPKTKHVADDRVYACQRGQPLPTCRCAAHAALCSTLAIPPTRCSEHRAPLQILGCRRQLQQGGWRHLEHRVETPLHEKT